MRRRTLLRWVAPLAAAARFPGVRAWAQTVTFPGGHDDTLVALAEIVLPSEIGPAGIREIARRFETWVRDYRPGAEMDHGYGFTRIRNKPQSPAPAYLRQLDSIRPALLHGDAASRRQAVEAALEDAKIADLPRTPDGRHIAADLMTFYFRGSDANDLCYRSSIGRDLCRGLKGSDNPPAPLSGKGAR
ncbi:MAG TPA: hypothetical protein VKU19_38285 [Bryobacteraceae bacterium]|nr:hypothetical protein [Bryobacteraceae bacterium]